jgi:hypothetical protein
MSALNLDSIKQVLFDLFIVASFCMTLLKMLVIEWRSVKRHFNRKRRAQ